MKRYSFLVLDKTITLDIPGTGKISRYQKTQEILAFFRFFIVATLYSFLAFGLVTSFLGDNYFNMETSLFIFSLVLVILAAGLYMFDISSNVSKRIVDPVGLFFVLIFGLITTASAVMVTPTDAENTFGSTGNFSVRALSGIGIMVSIAVYYLINSVYRSRKQIVNSYVYYAVGFTLFSVTTLLFSRYSIENLNASILGQANMLLLAHLFSLPILIFAVVKSSNLYAKLAFGISLFYSLFLLLSNLDNSTAFILSISGVITTLPLTILFFSKYDKFISNVWKNSTNLLEKIYAVGIFLVLTSLFVFIFASIYYFAQDSDLAKQSVENVVDGIDTSISSINNNTRTLLFGLGTADTSPSDSTIVSILSGQGIFGVFGYAIIFCYSMYLLFKTLSSQSNDYSIKITFLYFLGFTLIFIPVVGIFTYVTLYGVILWWINLGLLTSYYRTNVNKVNIDLYDFSLEKVSIFGKTFANKQAMLIRLFIGLTLLIASFILIYSLLNLRGDLI